MITEPRKDLTMKEARGMNRHERRRLGKLNGVKITGTTKPLTKPKNDNSR